MSTDGRNNAPRVSPRPCSMLFFEADGVDVSTLVAVAERVGALRAAWRAAVLRAGGSSQWTAIGDRALADVLPTPGPGLWRIELADASHGSACRVEAVRSPAWRGQSLMSSVRVDFAEDVQPAELTEFMVWAAERLPVWWGTAGLTFERPPSWGFLLDDDPVRALAKRYWAVQVLDPVLLLRDARTGMPGIGWLSLVSAGFARTQGLELETLARRCADKGATGVFHRLSADALAVAAGPRPIRGDINFDEDLTAYACVADLLAPLRTKAAEPGVGLQRHPERYAAWLDRYAEPNAWLNMR